MVETMAQSGIASTYHDGHPTGYTAAHRSLPFGAKVLVTNKRTVKIADSYPHIRGRVLDINAPAPAKIGFEWPG
jgi:rare lipoprotein A